HAEQRVEAGEVVVHDGQRLPAAGTGPGTSGALPVQPGVIGGMVAATSDDERCHQRSQLEP
ncbi:MAG TPA: hypothetical protein VFF71_08630, partial [Luteimonas sp.]|nr:hypothetical protein [Luteimonas sp.]